MISVIIIKQFGSDPYLAEVGIAPLKARTGIYQQGKWTLFLNRCGPEDEFPMIFLSSHFVYGY